jgi:hypothetical protein
MHVLPLPFGMALALVSKREATKLRVPKAVRVSYDKSENVREKVASQYFNAGRYIL